MPGSLSRIFRCVYPVQECGLRIGELCQLPFDCLKSNNRNQWRIQFMQWKINKEHTVPISAELAKVIQEQQYYIQNNLGNNFKFLFCGSAKGTKFKTGIKFKPEPKV
ncbi:MAG: tyrosine-type recombinase/integrase, partial [Tolypothrix sp. T3-bin4]|nr:tyrosine-type recombinase/integrase [Tolypothrix sp. T3-bin4]